MERNKGMRRKGEKQSRNIVSEHHLKHMLLIRYYTQPKSVSMHEQRSPLRATKNCWGFHCAPQAALRPYRHRVAVCPQYGGALTLSNPFSRKVQSRLENGGEKTRKKQGVGQRRKKAEGRKPAYLKKWNTYPTVEWRYDNLNFITFFLV